MNSPTQSPAGPVAIAIDSLRYAWPGGPTILDLPRLEIARGERVFVRGASGSGKSTLLGLLAGVLTPSGGSIRVFDTPLQSLSGSARDRFRADHIGFIFQQFNLLPYLSVVDNVLLPTRFAHARRDRLGPGARAEALRLLNALGLQDARLLSRPVTALSIGQQQRVAAARALLGRPPLVIADEPTSSLDADAREAFLSLLLQECAASDATLLFVSHDTSLGGLFDRTIDLPTLNRVQVAA